MTLKYNYANLVKKLSEEQNPPVRIWEQCDQADCPSRALYELTFKTGGLVFCGHHSKENIEKTNGTGIVLGLRRL